MESLKRAGFREELDSLDARELGQPCPGASLMPGEYRAGRESFDDGVEHIPPARNSSGRDGGAKTCPASHEKPSPG